MNWLAIYVGIGIPVILVAIGYALARYDRWERRHSGS
jgi:hypothetical protein